MVDVAFVLDNSGPMESNWVKLAHNSFNSISHRHRPVLSKIQLDYAARD